MQARKIMKIRFKFFLKNSNSNDRIYKNPLAFLTPGEKKCLRLLLQQKKKYIIKDHAYEVTDPITGEILLVELDHNLFVEEREKEPKYGYAILEDLVTEPDGKVDVDPTQSGSFGSILKLRGLINLEIDDELTYVDKAYVAKLQKICRSNPLHEIKDEVAISKRFKKTKMKSPLVIKFSEVDVKLQKLMESKYSYALTTMPEIKRMNLQTFLRSCQPLPNEVRIDISIKILRALQKIHDSDVLHRDMKPANIMIDYNEVTGSYEVVILDFGISIGINEESDTCAGTPAYLAPELYTGSTCSIASDTWSTGMVLFELWGSTGSPAKGSTLQELQNNAKNPDLSWVNPNDMTQNEAVNIIKELTACDPSHRIAIVKAEAKFARLRISEKKAAEKIKQINIIALKTKNLLRKLEKAANHNKYYQNQYIKSLFSILTKAVSDAKVVSDTMHAFAEFVDVLDIPQFRNLNSFDEMQVLINAVNVDYEQYTTLLKSSIEKTSTINPSAAKDLSLQKMFHTLIAEDRKTKRCNVDFDEICERTRILKAKLTSIDSLMQREISQLRIQFQELQANSHNKKDIIAWRDKLLKIIVYMQVINGDNEQTLKQIKEIISAPKLNSSQSIDEIKINIEKIVDDFMSAYHEFWSTSEKLEKIGAINKDCEVYSESFLQTGTAKLDSLIVSLNDILVTTDELESLIKDAKPYVDKHNIVENILRTLNDDQAPIEALELYIKPSESLTLKENIILIDQAFDSFMKQTKKDSLFFNHDLSEAKKGKIRELKRLYFLHVKKQLSSTVTSADEKAKLVSRTSKSSNIINYNLNFLFCTTKTRRKLNKVVSNLKLAKSA